MLNEITQIITDATQLTNVANALESKGYSLNSYDLAYIPASGERLDIDAEVKDRLTLLIDTLEEEADAVEVHTNSAL